MVSAREMLHMGDRVNAMACIYAESPVWLQVVQIAAAHPTTTRHTFMTVECAPRIVAWRDVGSHAGCLTLT